MKKSEGLEVLLGNRVTFFCSNYIYTGNLVEVNEKFVKLEKAGIVYETGSFDEEKWKDFQEFPNPVYVMLHAIESFEILKLK